VVLAPSPDHLSGLLDARELLTELRLDRTGLVVLAACSSAGGHAVGPEGLSALVRPFLTGGAPAVVGSLWEVGDDRTKGLLVRFHHYYEGGLDASVALQRAQLELINDKSQGLRSVLAWAPFQVIGHASSPFPPSSEGKRRSTP
jgi:CHAT domain-containing protein